GDEPNSGRFCRDRIEAQATRGGHRQELDDQDHRPATGRHDRPTGAPAPERDRFEPDQTLQRSHQGQERRCAHRDWRESRNHAHDPHVTDNGRILDHDDLCAGTCVSVVVAGAAEGRFFDRSLSRAGRKAPCRAGGCRSTSGRNLRRSRKRYTHMKMKTLELLRNLQHRLSHSRRWLFVAVIALCLIPSNTRAQGIGDILLLLHTITSTLQGPIGDALSEMRKVSAAVNNFRQKIIWPLALINQTRSFVSATRAHYTCLMSQIEGIKNNSATLALPMQLESMFRGAQSGSIGQIPSLYTQVYQPVALAGIAQPVQRNLMDIDDAMSMDSLKTAMVSDQTTQGMLTLADSLEQQAMTAA